MVQRVQRAVEHRGTVAGVHKGRPVVQLNVGLCQALRQLLAACGKVGHGCVRAYPQLAVQAAVGGGIGNGKAPIGQVRLHQLKTRGQPVQRLKQLLQRVTGSRRGAQAKHHLGLQAGLAQRIQSRVALAPRVQRVAGGVPHRAPNGLVHVVKRPNGAVGKADFDALGPLAACLAQRAHLQGQLVGLRQLALCHAARGHRPKGRCVEVF